MGRRLGIPRALSNGLVPCCLHSQVQFALGLTQVFLGLRSVSVHVVMIGGAGTLHFVNGFRNMLVNFLEIMPIADPLREDSPSYKRQTQSAYGKSLPHRFSPSGN
jgi:hypothetical protein